MRNEEQPRVVTPGAVYVKTPANARNLERWMLHQNPNYHHQQEHQQRQQQQQQYQTHPLDIVPPGQQVVGVGEGNTHHTTEEVQPHGTDLTSEQPDVDEFNSTGETSPPSSASHVTTTTTTSPVPTPTATKTAPHFFGSVRTYLRTLVPRVRWTKPKKQQEEEERESHQPSASIGRRAQCRQELLAQPSLLLPPPLTASTILTPSTPTISSNERSVPESTTNSASITTTTTTAMTTTTTTTTTHAREALGIQQEQSRYQRQGGGVLVPSNTMERRLGERRGRRHFSSEPSIPEDDVIDESGSMELTGEAQGDIEPSNTEEEVEREDRIVDQILEVFPHVDRRETYRLVREGKSIRRVLSGLCNARHASLSSSEFDIHSRCQSVPSISDHDHDEESKAMDDAIDFEVESMVQQIKEAFPDVDVDRSYSMLQTHSFDHVMNQLAEESLSNSSEFEVSGDSTGDVRHADITEDVQLAYLQEVFPGVATDELRCRLRQNSISSVVSQLLSDSNSPEPRDRARQEQLRQSLLRSFRFD
jgi:hypothetical protein